LTRGLSPGSVRLAMEALLRLDRNPDSLYRQERRGPGAATPPGGAGEREGGGREGERRVQHWFQSIITTERLTASDQ
jgi:hypothetical protein